MKADLPNFEQSQVLLIGDVMLDRYFHGNATRISPEAPVPVVQVDHIEERPGGAANVALNIAALGGKINLLGLTGNDAAASSLTEKLCQAGVNTYFQQISHLPTVTKSRVIGLHQQLLRMDMEQSFAKENPQVLMDHFQQLLAQANIVVLSDYNKGTLSQALTMITEAKAAGVPVLVDPKAKDFSLYQGATLLTPNRKEFEAVVGRCQHQHEMVERGYAVMQANDLQALLITLGGEGMLLLREGDEPLHLSTYAREVFDVTGAGDTVIGVLAAAIASGESLPQAMRLANLAAGLTVTKLGAATVNQAELRRALRREHASHHYSTGILTERQASVIVEDAKAHGERIVMTNGCFDILHAGHVQYLNEARALGDRLIVAVNEDATVRALKGEGRPINSLQERMEVLAGLQAVDWVVPFSEPTPARLIATLLPDTLVKGGDYQDIHSIAGAKEVLANGGDVQCLSFKPGCSTTRIIERVKADESLSVE